MGKNKTNNTTLNQASDFWDEHDFTEFPDTKEVFNLRFRFSKRKYVGVDYDLYQKIEHKAKAHHTTVEKFLENCLRRMAA